MMNDVRLQTEIYLKLYSALRQATKDEAWIEENTSYGTDTKTIDVLMNRFDMLSKSRLPDLLGYLISELGLQYPFLFLGQSINSFSDAEYIVKHLRLTIIAQLKNRGFSDPCPLIDDIVHSCNELAELRVSTDILNKYESENVNIINSRHS